MWLLTLDRLPVRTRLSKFIPNLDPKCGICSNHEETSDHLFFECTYAHQLRLVVWNKVSNWQPTSLNQWLKKLAKGKMHKDLRMVLCCVASAILNKIWIDRNEHLFQNKVIDWATSRDVVIALVKLRLDFVTSYGKRDLSWNKFCIYTN